MCVAKCDLLGTAHTPWSTVVHSGMQLLWRESSTRDEICHSLILLSCECLKEQEIQNTVKG